jgi:hypothetical protein
MQIRISRAMVFEIVLAQFERYRPTEILKRVQDDQFGDFLVSAKFMKQVTLIKEPFALLCGFSGKNLKGNYVTSETKVNF